MTRRDEMLAVLADGDATGIEMLGLLQLRYGWAWTSAGMRKAISELLQDREAWVCDLGICNVRPRRYTVVQSRAVAQMPERPERLPSTKPLCSTPAQTLQAMAISRRTALELQWNNMIRGTA